MADDSMNKIDEWTSDIKSRLKEKLQSIRDDVSKYLTKGVAEGLTKDSKKVVDAFKKMLAPLEYQRDFNIISEEEYYTKLEALRDMYFKKGSENWVKYSMEIYEFREEQLEADEKALEEKRKTEEKALKDKQKAEEKALKEKIKAEERALREQKRALEKQKKDINSLYDEISGYAIDRLEQVVKKQQALAESLKDSGSLYKKNTVIMGDVTDSYYSLGELDRDIEAIKTYGEFLEKVEARADALELDENITDGFLSVIRELDIESATGLANALLLAGDDKFIEYLNAWNTKELISEKTAAKLYEEDFEEGWDDAFDNMKELLEKAGYEIPEGFTVSGSISAQNFGEAFCQELEVQMQKIQSIVDQFNATLELEVPAGNTYNTTNNNSYNINGGEGDTVDIIRRYDTVRRLAGI